MEFGLQFFPDVSPDQKSGQQYWSECLALVDLCDELGYSHVRTVEHYFEPYGGYSPAPHVFLTAASQRTRNARLLTGAVLPVFNHPLKVAGEIGMLDAISGGRLDCGFGRAFLPHEFQRFERSMDESRAPLRGGVWKRCGYCWKGRTSPSRVSSTVSATSHPCPGRRSSHDRPSGLPLSGTPESLRRAGERGFNLMLVPFSGPQMREAIGVYREAWREASHPGQGRIALGFHMFCHEDREEAHRITQPNIDAYFKSLVAAAELYSGWGAGASSGDYPNYDSHMNNLRQAGFDRLLDSGTIWVGTPRRREGADSVLSRRRGRFRHGVAPSQLPPDFPRGSRSLHAPLLRPGDARLPRLACIAPSLPSPVSRADSTCKLSPLYSQNY